MSPRKSGAKLLTEVELELMNVVWKLGECTVKVVQSALAPERELAYTSVATMMKILEGKGVVKSRKTERAHLFRPLVERSEYEARSLEYLATNLFEGNPGSMVMRLISEADLSAEELKAIRAVLNERLKSS